MKNERPELLIGIDAGVNAGFSIWNKTDRKFQEVKSVMIHEALFEVSRMHEAGYKLFVRVEDARLRKWIPYQKNEKQERGRREGAGYVKAHSKIWEDFLKSKGIPHEMVAPKNNKTKFDSKQFAAYTGYQGKTNEHGRDAGMLVFGR